MKKKLYKQNFLLALQIHLVTSWVDKERYIKLLCETFRKYSKQFVDNIFSETPFFDWLKNAKKEETT